MRQAKSGRSVRGFSLPERWFSRSAPVMVALATGAMVVISAGRALWPAERVVVRQVVFDRADAAPSAPATTGRVVQAPGWLEADPYPIACTALADGVLAEVLALEGERVEAGQIVARLVPDDAKLALAAAEARLLGMRAELAMAEAELAAAEMNWDEPVERTRAVAVGQAALERTQAELDQLPSLIGAEEATLARMNEELARAQEALKSQAANALEVFALEKRHASQAATLEALRKRSEILEAQRRTLVAELAAAVRNADLRVNERRAVDAGRAAVEAARAGVTLAEANRDEAGLRLSRMTIRSPITGVVQRRLKAPGDKVMLAMDDPESAQILRLYDPERLQVRVDVPLADAAGVVVGQACEIVVDVLPDVTFAGEVTRITHEADVQKNTLQVKVRVIDPAPMLRPEMLTRVKFLAGAGAGVTEQGGASVLAPRAVIDEAGGGSRICVVRERAGGGGRVAVVDVIRMGEFEPGWERVSGALAPGDLALETGRDVRDGQWVWYALSAEGES